MAIKKPIQYNISPAKGQALLNFQGRRFPDKVELFETSVVEEIRQKAKEPKLKLDKQTQLNSDFTNLLIHGDCLSACAYLKSKNIKVDLVYIDPPFASGANYAKKIYLRNSDKTEVENDDNSIGEEIMYGDIWQKEDYLNWLYERLLAIREVMSETASIYVHLDGTIGHYVKLLLDETFGEEGYRNEIIWERTTAGKTVSNNLPRNTDFIFWYTKNEEITFNGYYTPLTKKDIESFDKDDNDGRGLYTTQPIIKTGNPGPQTTYNYVDNKGRIWKCPDRGWRITKEKMKVLENDNRLVFTKVVREKSYLREREKIGKQLSNLWKDISGNTLAYSEESVDYPTQKPEKLLQRITNACSNRGMIVADFFSGSGTTAKVAHNLGRKFIACDIGINAVQTARDGLIEAKADFDILKINDGVRLFRNPAQTQQKIFSLIAGFKNRTELELGEFWDGGIAASSGSYVPVKFVGIQEKLTKKLLDFFLEQIYELEAEDNVEAVKIIYAHKDLEIDHKYLEKALRDSKRTTIKVELTSLDDLLGAKRDLLFPPDNADIEVKKEKDKYKVFIKRYFSSYLKTKIDDFNAKKVKKQKEIFEEDGKDSEKHATKKITLSKTGLELIESIQFDTTLRKDGVWESNLDLEDKAGIKDKIKGTYILPTNKFKIKIRNIAGDEIVKEHF